MRKITSFLWFNTNAELDKMDISKLEQAYRG